MLITINRKIFMCLTPELKNTYVYEAVQRDMDGAINYEEEAMVSNAIVEIINTNEDWNKKCGTLMGNGLMQVDETCMVPGGSEPSGHYRLPGLLVAPFDWAWDENGDFDYSFEIFRVLQPKK